MSETELLVACRDLRTLATGWAGAAGVALIVAIYFGCLYAFGVHFRIPRLKGTNRRLAEDRDKEKAGRTIADGRAAKYKSMAETVGLEAQKEITRLDAIRKKTETSLIATKKELADAQDLNKTLEAFLAAINAQAPEAEVGSPESWVPGQVIEVDASGAATK